MRTIYSHSSTLIVVLNFFWIAILFSACQSNEQIKPLPTLHIPPEILNTPLRSIPAESTQAISPTLPSSHNAANFNSEVYWQEVADVAQYWQKHAEEILKTARQPLDELLIAGKVSIDSTENILVNREPNTLPNQQPLVSAENILVNREPNTLPNQQPLVSTENIPVNREPNTTESSATDILPLSTNTSDPLFMAVQQNRFQTLEANEQQIKKLQAGWQQLQSADQQFRYAGIAIAELRQQWRYVTPSHYPKLDSAIAELPTQVSLLEQRHICQILQSAYQQTMLANSGLNLPDTLDQESNMLLQPVPGQ